MGSPFLTFDNKIEKDGKILSPLLRRRVLEIFFQTKITPVTR